MTDSAERLYERMLVLRCQTGDEAAFEELVSRYHRRLRYYLRKMLGDAHKAEDALQDVWFDVFRKAPRLKDPDAFRAWLYRIARDRAYRLLRRERRMFVSLDGNVVAENGAGREFSAEDAEQIHVALDRLGPEHREILVLRFLEEMSYHEIARIVGCPVGTVRSRIHYAKQALRQFIDKDERQ